MKVRIIKDYKNYREGQIIQLKPKEVSELVDKGVARIDRMLTKDDPNFEVTK